MTLRFGDRVLIKNLGIEGQVIEVDTRTTVVRYQKPDGELIEQHFQADDLEYRPKPHSE
jgi:preprotein translocase subunit YajC